MVANTIMIPAVDNPRGPQEAPVLIDDDAGGRVNEAQPLGSHRAQGVDRGAQDDRREPRGPRAGEGGGVSRCRGAASSDTRSRCGRS